MVLLGRMSSFLRSVPSGLFPGMTFQWKGEIAKRWHVLHKVSKLHVSALTSARSFGGLAPAMAKAPKVTNMLQFHFLI